jgi:hypothetical protein
MNMPPFRQPSGLSGSNRLDCGTQQPAKVAPFRPARAGGGNGADVRKTAAGQFFQLTRLLACAAAMFLGACSSAATHYHSLTPIHQAIGPSSESGSIVCTSDATGPTTPGAEPIGTVLLAHLAVPLEANRMPSPDAHSPVRLRDRALGSPTGRSDLPHSHRESAQCASQPQHHQRPAAHRHGNALTTQHGDRGVGRACRKGSHRPRAVEIVGHR